MSCKMASKLCHKWLKKTHFCRKAQILYISDHTIWFKFCQHMVQMHIKLCMQEPYTSSISICNSRTEVFNGKFSAKNGFSNPAFYMIPLRMLTQEV